MRLLSHNLLMCNVKNCNKNNYPLKIIVDKSQILEKEFNKDFALRLIPKIDWSALYKTVVSMGHQKFPSEVTQELLEDEEFLKEFFNIVYNTQIVEGKLQCENCERVYPIVNGIPNLILEEHEL
mmetsp:Transcript_25114/g.22154  ORF Transcript_25114/g.22154 Transcript_25114/m.22154 type:complete len:124 (+) Transcript_25114:91-462(+)